MSAALSWRPRCPSAPAAVGANVIGAVQEDGSVAQFVTPLVADARFLEAARSHGPAERRFRFSSSCAEGKCAQWTGRECGLLGRVTQQLAEAGLRTTGERAPPCTIRAECRWFLQGGYDACLTCRYVVTDQRAKDAECA
jgi:hypothetical protein